MGAWLLLILNFLFNIAWTTVAISVSIHRDSPDRYVLPEVTCLSLCLSPVCLCLFHLPLSLSLLSGLVAHPPRGPGAPADPGGDPEGGAGHPAFEEEAPPLAGVAGEASP